MSTPSRAGQPWTVPELRRAAEAIARGVPAADVAAELGRTSQAVRNNLSKNGLGDRSRRDQRNRGDRWRSYALALRLRADGATWKEAHQAVVRRFGYGGKWSTLKQGCRAYQKALSRPTKDAG